MFVCEFRSIFDLDLARSKKQPAATQTREICQWRTIAEAQFGSGEKISAVEMGGEGKRIDQEDFLSAYISQARDEHLDPARLRCYCAGLVAGTVAAWTDTPLMVLVRFKQLFCFAVGN